MKAREKRVTDEMRRARIAQWQADNREKCRASTRRWRSRNPERVKANKRSWRSTPEGRLRHILAQARRRADANGMEFSICLDDLLPLPAVCPVLGVPINYGGTGARGFIDNSPSIDRMDSKRGYVPDNVQVICWRANRLKSDASVEELRSVLKYMEKAGAT